MTEDLQADPHSAPAATEAAATDADVPAPTSPPPDAGSPAPTEETADFFGPDEHILFVGRMQREYLCRLRPGQKIVIKGEWLDADRFIGLKVGTSVVTPMNQAYLALRPTLAERLMNMPREAQIIYPKDLALMTYLADVRPGAKVLEIGVGHGAMTMTLVRTVGPAGQVVSYERRSEFARQTRKNVRTYLGESPWWRVVVADTKSSAGVRLEHLLQVALYAMGLRGAFADAGLREVA